jgi:putative peptidoglycan lipid II flippase
MLIKVLAPGFYARQDTATPVKIGIIAMVANMLLNVAFVLPLMYYFNAGHVGLALATSVAACLNAGLLWRGLRREQVYRFQPGWWRYGGRLLAATAGMAAVVLWLAPATDTWLAWSVQQRAGRIALTCAAGALAYLLLHALLGTRMRDLRTPLRA